MLKGDKNLIALISLLLIQKKCIKKIIFLKKVCLGDSFPIQVSSSRRSGKCKCRVTHHWTNYANKSYVNLWFISIQVTKDFRFQKNKNVCFISGNFSSERFSWKVKTIQCGLYILINKHLCLEFTILIPRSNL